MEMSARKEKCSCLDCGQKWLLD